jgi:hypothetical protein
VVRRCVLSRNLVNEEALTYCGLSRQKKSYTITPTVLFLNTVCFLCDMIPPEDGGSLKPKHVWSKYRVYANYGIFCNKYMYSVYICFRVSLGVPEGRPGREYEQRPLR